MEAVPPEEEANQQLDGDVGPAGPCSTGLVRVLLELPGSPIVTCAVMVMGQPPSPQHEALEQQPLQPRWKRFDKRNSWDLTKGIQKPPSSSQPQASHPQEKPVEGGCNGQEWRKLGVSVHKADAEKALQNKFWPGMVVCRPKEELEHRRGSMHSRRSSRPIQHPSHPGDGGVEWKVRPNSPYQQITVREKQRTVEPVACSANSKDSNVKDHTEVEKRRQNTERVKKSSKVGDIKKVSGNVHKKKSIKNRKPGSRKNSVTDKNEKAIQGKSRRLSDSKTSKKSTLKTTSKKHNKLKPHVSVNKVHPKHAWQTPQEKKQQLEKIPNETKSRKSKKDKQKESRSRSISRTRDELMKVENDLVKYEKAGTALPSQKSSHNPTPSLRSGRKDYNKKHGNKHDTSQTADRLAQQHPVGKTEKSPSYAYPNWTLSLSKLLILSSEEAVSRLLGTDYDGLLTQDDISDDELFLGMKVLAHCARSRSHTRDLQHLVMKIWQPHIIALIKSFAVTVERHYPQRAERYFWDLAEFLDLYVTGNTHIAGMASLITSSTSEVLALGYRRYVSPELVKVFKSMENKNIR
ncbi:hypothetical protein Pcinc_034318 [Petrolisthes cinctipes]|uniref:Uncharacterized protein n=1 Tax=Petrolisthes cinctipes TaxID=88211 RepID=A0AAE1JVV0_PETCI|nr:hypothetical protein Pcinc_034318 [Petrolisthes cinctipes]